MNFYEVSYTDRASAPSPFPLPHTRAHKGSHAFARERVYISNVCLGKISRESPVMGCFLNNQWLPIPKIGGRYIYFPMQKGGGVSGDWE